LKAVNNLFVMKNTRVFRHFGGLPTAAERLGGKACAGEGRGAFASASFGCAPLYVVVSGWEKLAL
jgi:hypothetical protein